MRRISQCLLVVALLTGCGKKDQEPLAVQDAQTVPAVKHVPSAPAALPDTEKKPPAQPSAKRLNVEGELNPTHVTKRLIRQIAKQKWPLQRFLDGERGVFLYVENSQLEPIRSGKLHCGEGLSKKHKKIQGLFDDALGRESSDDDMMSCSNRNGRHQCEVAADMEYSNEILFRFAPGPKGLVLDAIFEINGVHTPEKEGARNLARAERRLDKARETGCPEP